MPAMFERHLAQRGVGIAFRIGCRAEAKPECRKSGVLEEPSNRYMDFDCRYLMSESFDARAKALL
jgi:hypothetical protein